MKHEHQDDGVEFQHRTSSPDTERQVLEDPAVVQPVCHDAIGEKRGGDRCALEVLALASCILGQHGDGDIESCKAGEAAEDEDGEEEGVERGAEADGEGDHSGGDAERDLIRVSENSSSIIQGCSAQHLPSLPGSQAPGP